MDKGDAIKVNKKIKHFYCCFGVKEGEVQDEGERSKSKVEDKDKEEIIQDTSTFCKSTKATAIPGANELLPYFSKIIIANIFTQLLELLLVSCCCHDKLPQI